MIIKSAAALLSESKGFIHSRAMGPTRPSRFTGESPTSERSGPMTKLQLLTGIMIAPTPHAGHDPYIYISYLPFASLSNPLAFRFSANHCLQGASSISPHQALCWAPTSSGIWGLVACKGSVPGTVQTGIWKCYTKGYMKEGCSGFSVRYGYSEAERRDVGNLRLWAAAPGKAMIGNVGNRQYAQTGVIRG
jgi:hypothetical protein